MTYRMLNRFEIGEKNQRLLVGSAIDLKSTYGRPNTIAVAFPSVL